MALLKIANFWSNLLEWGYQHNFPIWGYQHNFPIWEYQHNFQILWSDLLAWGYQHIFSTLHGSLWLGKDKGSIMESAESGGTIHLEINFWSKVYSKSLLRGLHGAKPIDLYFDVG